MQGCRYHGTFLQPASKLGVDTPAGKRLVSHHFARPAGMVIAFQEIEEYEPPVWPWQAGKQGQMLHLDFYVDNLEEAVRHALSLGARLAGEQYFRTSRTLIDPAGHPFCLDTDEPE